MMWIFGQLFGRRKPQQNNRRRISPASRRAVMRKLRPLLKKVERKDRAIANISREISRLGSRSFARANKRMKERVKANLFADREILLVEVNALEQQLNGYYAKNLSLAKKR
jgi:hypothetical protein